MTKSDGYTVSLVHPTAGRVFEKIPTGLFINNEFVASLSGKTFETVDPCTGKVICSVQEALSEDVNVAVAAAKTAYKKWAKVAAAERGKLLNKLADLLEKNIEKLAALETYDNGKPFSETLGTDLPLVIEHFRYFAGAADKIEGRYIRANDDLNVYTRVEPYGV
ncbi:hypothetical protein HK096_000630, partial [Nowakowskiella sp. JEL0078]